MNHVMFRVVGVFALFAATLASDVARADVPGQINHQGQIKVNGTLFNGTGQFRFAIFDPDTGQNYWTNDNTFVPGPGTPTAFVSITVTDGIYSVMLGDTSLTNMTNEIPPSIFKDDNVALRVWFNDGVNGIQQFDPHPLTSTPYAHQAQFQPPIGSIMAWHKNFANTPSLPDGWVECNGQTVSDTKSPYNGQALPDLNNIPTYADPANGTYIGGGRFLRGGLTSGVMQEGTILVNDFVVDGGWRQPLHLVGSDSDGTVTNNPIYATQFTSFNDQPSLPMNFRFVRPVNMSVVWIMRVK